MTTSALGRRLPVTAFVLFAMAAIVGVAGGVLSYGFQEAVRWLQLIAVGDGGTIADAGKRLEWWMRILVPTAGGVVAGVVLLFVVRGSPFGVTDIVELVYTRRGRIHAGPSALQIVSSATSIATGSSIGKEGPNSQLAATVGALLAHWFKASTRTRAVLLGCGVAAGMATSYGAPIAGALFVMEVVLGNFAMDVFAPIVVASVVATLVRNELDPIGTIYETKVTLTEPSLVLSAIVLGVLCAFGSIAFRKSLDVSKLFFARLPTFLPLRLGVGGAIVGAIGIWFPEVWGNGYDTLKTLVDAPPPLAIVGMLVLMKTLATAASTGSGAIGGIFTPNLVVGGAAGAAFGSLLLQTWPSTGDNRVAFALVGMAGLCAATTHAPITSILLVFEMTRDYGLILPLMLCSMSASIFARLLDPDSIYTARLRAKGHDVDSGIEQTAMRTTSIRELMRRDHVQVRDTASFDEVMELFSTTRHDAIYVVDADGRLLGHIHVHDVKLFLNDPSLGSVVIAADMTRPAPTAFPDETLAATLARFDDPELEELAVVKAATTPTLLGRVTRRDLIAMLSNEVGQRRSLRARLSSEGGHETSLLELPAGVTIERIPVPEDLVGRALDTLETDDEVGLHILLVVQPGVDGRNEPLLAEPALVLAAGATLVALGTKESIAAFRRAHAD
jgi:CIC family chloride channel protein